MKASEGTVGRVFILRLDNGDIVPDCIEEFASKNGIITGQVILVGGIGGGNIVVGPEDSTESQPRPMSLPVDGAHEVLAVGFIAPSDKEKPVLHIHGALGRAGHTLSGCLRLGVPTWLVGEATIVEFKGIAATRHLDEESGFSLLRI